VVVSDLLSAALEDEHIPKHSIVSNLLQSGICVWVNKVLVIF